MAMELSVVAVHTAIIPSYILLTLILEGLTITVLLATSLVLPAVGLWRIIAILVSGRILGPKLQIIDVSVYKLMCMWESHDATHALLFCQAARNVKMSSCVKNVTLDSHEHRWEFANAQMDTWFQVNAQI